MHASKYVVLGERNHTLVDAGKIVRYLHFKCSTTEPNNSGILVYKIEKEPKRPIIVRGKKP